MDLNSNNVIHIVVDMLYDFIDGSLACKNSISAVEKSIEYINNNPLQKVLYICDCHPADHISFVQNGGQWPQHCIEGTHGQHIHEDYFTKVVNVSSRPNTGNMFSKGECSTKEQYSCIDSINNHGEFLAEFIKKLNFYDTKNVVVISGIATEFCVMDSSLDLMNSGNKVYIVTDGLAYVDYQGHLDALNFLKEKGANFV